MLKIIKDISIFLFHIAICLLGGIIALDRIKYPKTTILTLRIIYIIYIIWIIITILN
jgi:hypothetical protein